MASWVLMIVVALATFFFADSIVTPLILLLWKKIWIWGLKLQALFTKKNLMQTLVQSLILTAKGCLRLINKTVTTWILPLLLTRRQRYWLHERLEGLRRWIRMRLLRGWVRYRRQPAWIKVAMLAPAALTTVALFVASGFLLAALFGVSFVVPWLGSLPLATIIFLRRQLARLALFVFERLGLGPVINKVVDWAIDIIWWRTPEPVQRRFDAWWRRFKMRLRRRVIGPRRRVVRQMSRLGLSGTASNAPPRAPERRVPPEISDLAQRRDGAEPDLGLPEQPALHQHGATARKVPGRARLDALEDRHR